RINTSYAQAYLTCRSYARAHAADSLYYFMHTSRGWNAHGLSRHFVDQNRCVAADARPTKQTATQSHAQASRPNLVSTLAHPSISFQPSLYLHQCARELMASSKHRPNQLTKAQQL